MSYCLEKYNLNELKKIAVNMDLPVRRSKTEMISDISKAFDEYENYKKEKIDKYRKIYQLGEPGKEGTTFLAMDKDGNEFAMKTFRKKKSSRTLYREYSLQKKASKFGIAPKVYDYDTVGKWILMEKMDSHLLDIIKKEDKLSKVYQKRIIEIFEKLDEAGVYHNDANLSNYMMKDGVIYLIDYGFAKQISERVIKEVGKNPNIRYMLIGLILKLKEMKLRPNSYNILISRVSEQDKKSYRL